MGFAANDEGQSPPTFYSLPTYYEKTYGADVDALFNIPELTDGEATTYEDKVHAYYEEKMGASKSTSKCYMYRVGSWWAYLM